MKNKIGAMQGQLVPKYQTFPIGMWQDEFKAAQECGLDLIGNSFLKCKGIQA